MMPGKWNLKWCVNVICLNLPLLFPTLVIAVLKQSSSSILLVFFLRLRVQLLFQLSDDFFFFFKFQHSLKLFPCCQATAVLKSSGYLLSRRNFLHESPDTRLHASIHDVCHEKPVFNLHKEMIQLKFYCKYGVIQKTHTFREKSIAEAWNMVWIAWWQQPIWYSYKCHCDFLWNLSLEIAKVE